MRVKSSGVAPWLANARSPGSAKFATVSPPGTNKAGKCPTIARRRGGGGVLLQLELTGNEVKDVSFACNLFLIN